MNNVEHTKHFKCMISGCIKTPMYNLFLSLSNIYFFHYSKSGKMKNKQTNKQKKQKNKTKNDNKDVPPIAKILT